MLGPVIFGLLVAVGFSTNAAAQNQPGKGGKCTGFLSLGPKDHPWSSDLPPTTKDLRVRINAKGPELHLRVEPNPAWKSSPGEVQRLGRILIFSCETGSPVQSLEVESQSTPEMFLRSIEARDINFDGYLDLGIVREFGAKWGRYTWWVFSPAAGKFVSDELTEELGQISANGLELDAAQQNITAPQLTNFTGCGATKHIFHVEQNLHLVPIHREEIDGTAAGCTLTISNRVNGQMKVTKVQHFSPYREAVP